MQLTLFVQVLAVHETSTSIYYIYVPIVLIVNEINPALLGIFFHSIDVVLFPFYCCVSISGQLLVFYISSMAVIIFPFQ